MFASARNLKKYVISLVMRILKYTFMAEKELNNHTII
jgi:hypothetical protein